MLKDSSSINVLILSGLNYGDNRGYVFPSSFIMERVHALRKKNISPTIISTRFVFLLITKIGCLIIRHRFPKCQKLDYSERYSNENMFVISGKWPHFPYKYSIEHYTRVIVNKIVKVLPPISKYTILHVHWSYPHAYIGMLVAQKLGIPYIVTTHGSDINEIAATDLRKRKYIMKGLNNAHHVIFVSNASLLNAKEYGYDNPNSSVIPNGVNLSLFHYIPREDAEKLTDFKITKKYVVGFVGRLNPDKRAEKLPIIFNYIIKQLDDIEFIVVGNGLLEKEIRNECTKYHLPVTFVPAVKHDEVNNWMNLFDVLLLPSKTEGWPCVILESFASGTPVIGSDAGGIPEAIGTLCPVIPDGINFESRYAEVVCNYLLTNSKDKIKSALIKRANEYTWEKCIEKEIRIYHGVLAENSRR